MIPTAEIESVALPVARSEGLAAFVGEKRPPENGNDGGLGARSPKKVRGGGDLVGVVKKVAEIVLVLAVMGKIRAGRCPSAAEKEMMELARGQLVEICEDLAPKSVFPRDSFGIVIEDLGLDNLKERRSKMSISQKLLLNKRKMENSKEFSEHSGTYSSQRLQTNSGAANENLGALHTIRMFPSDKQTHAPTDHCASANSSSLPYQLPATEVNSSILSSGLPRVERAHFRLDGRSNGSSYTLQGQAKSSADQSLVQTPTWSLQSQPVSSDKTGPGNKVPDHPSVRVEGIADLSTSQVAPQSTTSKPLPHQHLQGMDFVQTSSLYYTHNEIGKIVQKLLQSQLPEHPTWTPPSRDYMNKALTCHICKVTINGVEHILVCDACEKGFHLKCLQPNNQKGIPRCEWHCSNCLMLSNGKPLPPKYGRVMRNINATKVSSNTPNYMVSGSNMPNANEMLGNEMSLKKENINGKIHSEIGPNCVLKFSGPPCVSPNSLSVERVCEAKLVSESKAELPVKLPQTVSNALNHSKASNNLQDTDKTGLPNRSEILLKPHHDKSFMVKDSEICYAREASDCNLNSEIRHDVQGVTQANGACNQSWSSSDGLHGVDWIGDVFQVVDEKIYYQSCCINGIVYKLHDHAVFRSSKDVLIPYKLQAMWEDDKTRSKWVIVSRCYFPGDLPEAVGRPCAPKCNEVYESNHDSAMMAGLIRGPCEVLHQTKFIEENERRTHLGAGTNDGLRPLYLCRWFYDKSKALFRDISSCG